MYTYGTNCCGVQEIGGLNAYTGRPAEAMKAFCKKVIPAFGGATLRYGFSANTAPEDPIMYSHYTFTAAVYDKDCQGWDTYKQNEKNIEDGVYNPYGHQFAKFIKDNNLGEVTTTGAVFNRLAHPDHKVQIWVWTPNPKALYAWYQNFDKFDAAERARKEMERVSEARKKAQEEEAKAQTIYEAAMKRITPDFTPAYKPITAADALKAKRVVKPRAVRGYAAIGNIYGMADSAKGD